jgi:uncharacterized protein (TIGR02246 family)
MSLPDSDARAVEALMIRYAFAADTRDPAAMASLFTSDAVIDGPWGTFQGPDGVRNFADRFRHALPVQSRHLVTNVLVEGEGDQATFTAYYVQITGGREVRSTGMYTCTARKVDGTWRLSRRSVVVDVPSGTGEAASMT